MDIFKFLSIWIPTGYVLIEIFNMESNVLFKP